MMPLTASKLGRPLTDFMLLNVSRCKELVTSFSKTANNFPSFNSDYGQLEVVSNARIEWFSKRTGTN